MYNSFIFLFRHFSRSFADDAEQCLMKHYLTNLISIINVRDKLVGNTARTLDDHMSTLETPCFYDDGLVGKLVFFSFGRRLRTSKTASSFSRLCALKFVPHYKELGTAHYSFSLDLIIKMIMPI